MQDLYATIEATALAFIANIGEDNDNYLAEELTTSYGPLQQEIPEDSSLAELDNATYQDYFKLELDSFTIGSKKRLLDSAIDPKKRKAWLWYQLEFKQADELLGAPYEKVVMEVMWLLDFTEDGKLVTSCRQYLDTVACDAFFSEQAEAAPDSVPAMDLGENQAAHESLTALTAIEEHDEVDDFLRSLTVSRS
ncbi:hypothetical protein Slin15195_G055720 [Septoria linicola]|uniref:Uncharacterized protein n=1 Tax=Septoria linicola TaxID=215465 RepID=A0A9Q9AS89_9PEZI|nr:hypothetical protein Slin14017_G071590 [Septoria linicola]USW52253.1 hypothetical protein Slin15195_G055720 [Septoria linicola]